MRYSGIDIPGKHVRFAHTDIIHYLPTPPPSNSSLLSPSSSSLLNPPSPSCTTTFPCPWPAGLPPSPYNSTFSLPLKPVQLHVLLQHSRSPVLIFDLRQPPSTITSHYGGIRLRALFEPATHPPLAGLTIIIPYLPWSLTVNPSHRPRNESFVTVEDIFQQLYDIFRTGISAQEFQSLLSEKDRSRVATAYRERYRRIHGPCESEDEKRCGVRRVDFLMGQTRFMGLSPSTTRSDIWVLHSA